MEMRAFEVIATIKDVNLTSYAFSRNAEELQAHIWRYPEIGQIQPFNPDVGDPRCCASVPTISVRQVAEWMGHANPTTTTTELAYTHLYAKADHDEIAALGALATNEDARQRDTATRLIRVYEYCLSRDPQNSNNERRHT